MGRRLALLIGNQSFKDGSGFEPLKGPHNDVDALAAVLADPARGAFAEVHPLKDIAHRPLVAAIRRRLREASAEDEVLIHYSGHGQPDDGGRLFFAAADSHAEELAATALRAADLQEWMAHSPASSVVLLLDCCFAGAFGKVLTGGLRGAHETSIQQQLREAASRGRYILSSCTSWQTSREAEGEAGGLWMGRFTRALVERLTSGVGDAEGWIRFSHLAAHVRRAFPGQDPRAFRVDEEGDPGIARAVPRETPEQRREKVLTGWLQTERLPAFVYVPAFEAVHGRGAAGLVALVARLLDIPGMTPEAFAAAVRQALPGEVPPPIPPGWPLPSQTHPDFPRPPAAALVAPLLRYASRRRFAWLLAAVPLAGLAYVIIRQPWQPEPPPAIGSAERPLPAPVTPPAVAPAVVPTAPAARPAAGPSPAAQVPLPPPGTVVRDCDDICPRMIVIPGGSFEMGAADGEVGANADERPRQRVTVPSIAVGKFEVTFAEWDAANAAGAKLRVPEDAGWGRGNRPVINVSWNDAQAYVAWLNEHTKVRRGSAVYRLLTEAEWEYASRAGSTTPFSFGETLSTAQANCGGSQTTVPVGSLPANAWGLHEMHGNVWEWVEDVYGPYPGTPTDSRVLVPAGSNFRVLRGGSWNLNPRYCRSASRNWDGPGSRNLYVGFRLARTLF